MKIYHLFKRLIDILVSSIVILILSPLLIIISIWIKLTSKGPVIYKHTRVGEDRKLFNVYKFRSMVVGARKLQAKGHSSDRLITSAGRFIRKTYLDEIPQLFNVLKGDMTLIGPRPFDKEWFYKSKFVKAFPKVREVVKIKPGLTSLHSIADYLSVDKRIKFEKRFKGLLEKDKYVETTHKYNIGSEKYLHVPSHHRYTLDSYYIENESPLLDLRIVYHTSLLVLKKIFSKQ